MQLGETVNAPRNVAVSLQLGGETFWWAPGFLLLDHNAASAKSDSYNWCCRFATCVREYAACEGPKHEQDLFYRGRGCWTRRQRERRLSALRSSRENGCPRCRPA